MQGKSVGAHVSCAARVVDRHSPYKILVRILERKKVCVVLTAHAGMSCAKTTEASNPRRAHLTPKVLNRCMTVDQ
jgi:hypothetical protein